MRDERRADALNVLSWVAVALVTLATLTFDHWSPLFAPFAGAEPAKHFRYEPSYYTTPEAKEEARRSAREDQP